MTTKEYELILPYYKQGDDLHASISEVTQSTEFGAVSGKDAANSFVLLAKRLEDGARILRQMASMTVEHGVTIEDACTHSIYVSVDDKVAAPLLAEGTLHEVDFDEDFDDLDDLEDDELLDS